MAIKISANVFIYCKMHWNFLTASFKAILKKPFWQCLSKFILIGIWTFWFPILCTVLFIKSRFFKNRELYLSNLPQNSNFRRELVQKSGVQIPSGKVKFFLSRFLFIFIFSKKTRILTHEILFFIFFC